MNPWIFALILEYILLSYIDTYWLGLIPPWEMSSSLFIFFVIFSIALYGFFEKQMTSYDVIIEFTKNVS